uniref:E3 SUMO-protein ligase NSE2 n=1 Tax=Acrobeloides nanus TaxID=290746 RepID=A0A914C8Q7_9BILA
MWKFFQMKAKNEKVKFIGGLAIWNEYAAKYSAINKHTVQSLASHGRKFLRDKFEEADLLKEELFAMIEYFDWPLEERQRIYLQQKFKVVIDLDADGKIQDVRDYVEIDQNSKKQGVPEVIYLSSDSEPEIVIENIRSGREEIIDYEDDIIDVSQQEIDEFENSAQMIGNQETTAEITTVNEEPTIEMEESCEIDLSLKMDVDRLSESEANEGPENPAQTIGNQETTAEITAVNEESTIEMEESCEIDLSLRMDVDQPSGSEANEGPENPTQNEIVPDSLPLRENCRENQEDLQICRDGAAAFVQVKHELVPQDFLATGNNPYDSQNSVLFIEPQEKEFDGPVLEITDADIENPTQQTLSESSFNCRKKPKKIPRTVPTYKLDPFTKLLIKDPVINLNCGHIYDHTGIYEYLKQKTGSRRISLFKRTHCPVAGCGNKDHLTLACVKPYPEFFDYFPNP